MSLSATRHFADTGLSVSALMARYSALFREQRKGRLDQAARQEFADLGHHLNERLQFIPVLPQPQDQDLQAQLIGRDRVHDFGVESAEQIAQYRLGNLNTNKTAFALVNPEGPEGARQILAAIYTYWQTQGAHDSITDFHDLQGDVAQVLTAQVSPRATSAQAAIFYSISNFEVMAGGGQMLISRLHNQLTADLPAQTVLSTLSPLRGLGKWIKEKGISADSLSDDDMLKRTALAFLLDNADGVQRFHMGNGAIIGDINLHANKPGSLDDCEGLNVMVNYVYDRDASVLQDNQVRYARAMAMRQTQPADAAVLVYRLMADHLVDEMSRTLSTPARTLSVSLDPA